MELVYYSILLIFAIFSAFITRPINKKDTLFVLCFIFLWFVIIRSSGFDIDIKTYSSIMKYSATSFADKYFLREPIWWLGSGVLYKYVTHSDICTFLVYDVLGLVLIIAACKNYRLSVFYVFLWYLSFVSLMGYQNIYRQYLASCFIVYAVSLFFKDSGVISKGIFSLFAILTHNLSILFSPVIVFRKKYLWLSLFIVFSIMYIGAQYKSQNVHTGLDLKVIYLFMIILFAVFILLNSKKYSTISYFSIIIALVLFIMFPDDRFERFSMIILQFIMPFILLSIQRYKPVFIPRLVLLFIFIAPIFLFNSALQFLI